MTTDLFKEIWSVLESRIRFGVKPGLERMHAALDVLGHPETHFSTILIAGTNGKGSTAFCLEQLLRARGLSTGLFLSPHLLHPGERIAVCGSCLDASVEPTPRVALEKAWAELSALIDPLELSYFECLTLLGLLVFHHAGIEWAVLECGMGGRFDATNAVDADLSILTSVGADHLEWLGGSLETIAVDKAGIARWGQPFLAAKSGLSHVIESPEGSTPSRTLEEIVRSEVSRLGGRYVAASRDEHPFLEDVAKPLKGAAALALQALDLLVSDGKLEPTTPLEPFDFRALPGRFDLRLDDPPLLLDVAHNQPALEALSLTVQAQWPEQTFHIFLAAMEDKMLEENILALAPIAKEIIPVVFEGHRRAASGDSLHAAIEAVGCIPGNPCTPDSLREQTMILHAKGLPVLVTGSFLSVASWLGAKELPPGL